ncbi:MAG: HlyD family efflux transporter periplasmic adaptor subunit [Candidatus Pacebacteria bacterium]|nr:HlyD family efflux transporter periplasmic adaptor subunit [Candidatus Paceibacterota bacterium]
MLTIAQYAKRVPPFVRKAYSFLVLHRWYTLATVALMLGGAYGVYVYWGDSAPETRYVPFVVRTTDIETAVSGSGQLSASNQIDLKTKVSGDVVFVGADAGDTVRAGAIIVQLDTRSPQKAVRDAEANLQSAKLSLQKLEQPPTDLEMLQAENAVAQARQGKTDATEDLASSYESGFSSTAEAFLDLPSVMAGLNTIIYGHAVNTSQDNINAYRELVRDKDPGIIELSETVIASYQNARDSYDAVFDTYSSVSRTSATSEVESLIKESYNAAHDVAEAVKRTADFLNHVNDIATTYDKTIPSAYNTHQTSLASYTSTMSGHVTSLLAAKNAIESARVAITTSERTLSERQASLADLKSGSDTLDLESQRIAVRQRENALRDAKEALADYYVRAPFDGVMATRDVQKGESVSGVVGTFISKSAIAEVTLNEVDVAQVEVGQAAALAFDALEGVELVGEVLSIDPVGTVTQGVVSYGVKIGFKAGDARIKPGMSVSATIVTASKSAVLAVPLAAVKTDRTGSYVEVLDGVDVPAFAGRNRASTSPDIAAEKADDTAATRSTIFTEGITSETAPRKVSVETGLANDTMVEIVSGLSGGEVIVSRTITETAGAAKAQTSLFPTPGGNRQGTSGQRTGGAVPR